VKRVVWTVLGLLVVVALVLRPALAYGGLVPDADSDDTVEDTTITDYVVDMTVDADGDLHAVETITVEFPSSDKHGIFRFWDRTDEYDAHARRAPEIASITRDGRPEPYGTLDQDGRRFTVAQIGDKDVTLTPGEHTYVLDYTVPNALDANDPTVTTTTEDEAATMLYWQLVPRGWQQRIERASLTVHLPVPAQDDVACAVGRDATSGCEVQGGGTTDLTVTTGPLEPRTPVTIATGLAMATPALTDPVPWSPRWDGVLGTSVPLLVLVLLLAAAAVALGALLARRVHERSPGFPLQYVPPEGIGPAQAVYVLREHVDRTTWIATMMYAAERGAITLTRDGDDWTIADRAGAQGWQGLDPQTRGLASLLSGPGTSFTASKDSVSSGERLGAQIEEFEKGVTTWATSAGVMTTSRIGGLGGFLVLAAAAAAIMLALVAPGGLSVAGLVPAGFALTGGALARTGAGTRRTRRGRELWSQVGGFERVLATDSSQARFDFSGRTELYTAYVPWAVAFGCADAWARKYRVETGSEPPAPAYLPVGIGAAGAGSYVDAVSASFESAVGSAISSYEATQSSSSSGGGFSGGGGGGGGGGGSW
jgi:hypothetical protein